MISQVGTLKLQAVSVMWENHICMKSCVKSVPTLFLLPVPRVEVSYQRMEKPACLVVDASPSREKVLQAVLSLIQDNCH